MSGRTIGTLVALLAIVAGAWLSGVFDGDDTVDASTEPREPRREEASDDPNPGDVVTPGVAKTDRYDESKEARDVEAVKRGVASSGGGYRLVGKVVSDEGPVARARVDLMEDNGTMAGVHQMGVVVDTVEADANGKFTFEGVEPGVRMILRATHEDYTMGRAYGIDAAKPGTLHQIIRVEAGHSIRGSVTHRDGRPLEGVRVAAYDINLQAFEPEDQLERAVLTGPDGRFEIRGLTKGIKRVLATQAGLATKSVPTFQVPSTQESIDFVLDDGFIVEGRVVEKDTAQGVAGARVMFRVTGSRSHGAHRRVESVMADEDGKFTLIGLESGNCEVWARGETHLQSQRQIVQAGATGVRIELPRAGRIEGVVVDGATNEPIKQYTLLITGNQDIIIPSRMYRRRIKDPEGRFVFDGLRPMKLWAVVRAEGYAETLHGPLEVASGQVVSGLVVKVGRGATVRGRVVDDQGQPVAVAKVTLSRSSIDMSRPESAFLGPLVNQHAPKVHGVTDKDGNYEISGLRAGKWTIKAEHARYATDFEIKIDVAGSGITDAPDLRVKQAGGVRGIVRNKEGQPDPKARISIAALHNQLVKFTAGTGPDGRFERLGIPPGDYKIVVVQRDGVVNLGGILGGMGRGEAPKVYTILPGQVLEVEL